MTPEDGARESRPFPDPEHSLTPRKPRTIGGAVYLAVLAATAVGMAMIALGPWRSGLRLIGLALLAGAVARLVIRDDKAGMLGMRPKVVDVVALAGLGGGLVVLAGLLSTRTPL